MGLFLFGDLIYYSARIISGAGFLMPKNYRNCNICERVKKIIKKFAKIAKNDIILCNFVL